MLFHCNSSFVNIFQCPVCTYLSCIVYLLDQMTVVEQKVPPPSVTTAVFIS